jgi:hypothetical protein
MFKNKGAAEKSKLRLLIPLQGKKKNSTSKNGK